MKNFLLYVSFLLALQVHADPLQDAHRAQLDGNYKKAAELYKTAYDRRQGQNGRCEFTTNSDGTLLNNEAAEDKQGTAQSSQDNSETITTKKEYRRFTNRDGKTIIARLVQYDLNESKVLLELKNRKRAWVDIFSLSEADQAYIHNICTPSQTESISQKETVPSYKPLTKNETKRIAEQYIDAYFNRDYEKWLSLMADSSQVEEKVFSEYFDMEQRYLLDNWNKYYRFRAVPKAHVVKKIDIVIVEKDSVLLRFMIWSKSYSREDHAMLLLQPDGKIKYDAIFVRHPLIVAMESIWSLPGYGSKSKSELSNEALNLIRQDLYKTGIPLFDYDPEVSLSDQKRSIDKMREWWKKNLNKWDASDPEVYLPRRLTEHLNWVW